MIVGAILDLVSVLLSDFWNRVFGWVPEPPAWVSDGFGYAGMVWSKLAELDAWIPWTLTFTCAGLVMTTWVISVGIKAVRTVISYLTFGGGVTS